MSAQPKLKYFGTSGIRGRTLVDITPNFAERMARAYVDVVLSGIDQAHVVIGRDTRFGAETLELAIIAGLTASGISVKRCGIVPTPVLLTYQQHINADGAVIITGSHIAPDRIGLIFIESDGSYCSDHVTLQIEQRFEIFKEHDGLLQIKNINDLQRIGSIEEPSDVWEIYFSFLNSKINLNLIKTFKGNLVVDPGNGTAAHFFTKFLSDNEIKVTSINDKYLSLPNRFSEPIEANLDQLKLKINNVENLGIAFDLDADRVTFMVINEESQIVTIPADHMGALFIDYLLKNKNKGEVILPINSSLLAEIILEKFNKKPIYCKIGQPATIEIVKKVPNPLFSYEESGKFYFLNEGILWTDGMLMVLKTIELLVESNRPLYTELKETFSTYLEYISITKKIIFDEEKIITLKEKFNKKLEGIKFSGETNRINIDGIRINFDNKSWLLFRASGTEPAYKIVANAKNKALTEELILKGEFFFSELVDDYK
ncbi:MAG: Phosphoglucosamine mutase [Candidatus Heimdallarchaeota archaeon LC_3]|nr:MAG: Phosphoglucosamine mutase [Candidatus Heimdallarchaeota archaeon LC_3]